MESKALLELVDQLDGNLESLEEALNPLLADSLVATTKKLPILDRAKLNITVVYAIESLLFSYLKINGVNAREHPVFKELERVKHYFGKMKEAEERISSTKPSTTLDKQAAARMIQHSLAGKGTPDMVQRANELRERIMAKRKSLQNGSAPATPAPETPAPIESADTMEAVEMLDSLSKDIEHLENEGSEEGEIEEDPPLQHPLPQKPHLDVASETPPRPKRKQNDSQSSKLTIEQKAGKKARKKAKKESKKSTDIGVER